MIAFRLAKSAATHARCGRRRHAALEDPVAEMAKYDNGICCLQVADLASGGR
jgi:hypothetical protein